MTNSAQSRDASDRASITVTSSTAVLRPKAMKKFEKRAPVLCGAPAGCVIDTFPSALRSVGVRCRHRADTSANTDAISASELSIFSKYAPPLTMLSTKAVITIAIRLRYDYDPTTTYSLCLRRIACITIAIRLRYDDTTTH